MKNNTIVITYGTFDLLHIGHLNLLHRAKKLGDYLIVGVTDESYDRARGKLNVHQSLEDRISSVKETGLADEIIIEKEIGQKINDIQKHGVDIFAIGDDWLGKFDYLNSYCDVKYLPRTQGISSTILRNQSFKTIRLGFAGTGRIANRFAKEVRFVSSIEPTSVYGRSIETVRSFAINHDIPYGFDDYIKFLDSGLDAVYIATPHETHYEYAKIALLAGKHVLCEKPATLSSIQLNELLLIAKNNGLVFLEAIKTAFLQGFQNLISECKSGILGEIHSVSANFTKLVPNKSSPEWRSNYGGALNELSSYPLLLIEKILGQPKSTEFNYCLDNDVDSFTTLFNKHDDGRTSVCQMGIGVKTEGCAVISGTSAYIYIPAPWWITRKYHIRFEDPSKEIVRIFDFDGDGLRYEIAEFSSLVLRNKIESTHLNHNTMIAINKIISTHNNNRLLRNNS